MCTYTRLPIKDARLLKLDNRQFQIILPHYHGLAEEYAFIFLTHLGRPNNDPMTNLKAAHVIYQFVSRLVAA